MNTAALKRYANWFFAKKKLQAKLKQIETKLEKESTILLDHLADLEVDKVSLKGGITLFTKTTVWAKYKDKQSAVNAIREAGEEWMISEGFNSITLSSFLRELDKTGQKLPEEFKGVIEANPKTNLIAKKL